MRSRKLTDSEIEHYSGLLEDPSLIGVAFFTKEAGQVVVFGDVAGRAVIAQHPNVLDAIDGLRVFANLFDKEISAQFGPETVDAVRTAAESAAKTEATNSLREKLKGTPGIANVLETPTAIAVILSKDGQYDGPWEWEGYPVYAEAEV